MLSRLVVLASSMLVCCVLAACGDEPLRPRPGETPPPLIERPSPAGGLVRFVDASLSPSVMDDRGGNSTIACVTMQLVDETLVSLAIDARAVGLTRLALRDDGKGVDLRAGDGRFCAALIPRPALASGRYELPLIAVTASGEVVGPSLGLLILDREDDHYLF